jgi:hypothetical protein
MDNERRTNKDKRRKNKDKRRKNKNRKNKHKRQDNFLISYLFPVNGEAMTKWWLKLSFWCFIISIIPIDSFLYFFKGTSAASALCIFIGYYVFSFLYNIHHEQTLTEEFYINYEIKKIISYNNYLTIDTVVHICLPLIIYYFWHKYITIPSAIFAFLFHRSWSLINSNYTSLFLDGCAIYNIKQTPSWCWKVIYIGESTVLILSTIFAFYLKT